MNGSPIACRLRALCLAWLGAFAFICAAPAANEAALLELWEQQQSTPEEHDAVIKACRDFAAANPNDPLLPVAAGIEAWHHFRAGREAEGWRLIEASLTAPPGPVGDSARALALGWLTRRDRERVAAALQLYYRQEIAYPQTLEQVAKHPRIPADARPPVSDRFGKPWSYRLTGLGKVPGLEAQKYALQSPTLGDLSDVKATLKIPYASRIVAVSAQLLAGPGGTVAMKFNQPGKGAAVVGLGQAAGDLHLAFVGAQIVVVCDFTHWKVFPKP